MLKKSKLTIAGVLALSLFVSACATQHFNLRGKPVMMMDKSKAKTEMTSHFFVAGLGQSDMVRVARVCGGASKVKAVETQLTFVDGLLGVVTLGIYAPRTYRVYCRR